MKSIREVATELGISHTQLSNIIKTIENEENVSIGTKQGKGKPTLLSDDDIDLIRERFFTPVDPHPQVSLVDYTPVEADGGIDIIRYSAPTTEKFLLEKRNQLLTEFRVAEQNSEALKLALLAKMRAEGKVLGMEMFQEKYQTAMQMMNNLESGTLGKEQGLAE